MASDQCMHGEPEGRCSSCAACAGSCETCPYARPAPDPAVQAESTGGLSAEVVQALIDAAFGDDPRGDFERILADRLAARAAVQAREVAEARADERAVIAEAFTGDEYEDNAAAAAGEGEWSWWRWLVLNAPTRAARLARAGGEGE